MDNRICNSCHNLKKIGQYSLNKSGNYFKSCNPCRIRRKQYYLNRRTKALVEMKQYRGNHKEETKQYNKDHKEEKLLYNKQYRKDNVEEIKQYNKDRREENKKWRSRNWNKCLVNSCRTKDRICNRYFALDVFFIRQILEHQDNGMCYHCNKLMDLTKGDASNNQISIDRVNNNLGHSRGNVVLAHWGCNNHRHSTPIEKFTPNPKYTILPDPEI